MSFKINKYSNFVVDKINELPESSMKILHGIWKYIPTARHSHTLNINVSSGWNRACGPATESSCQAGVHVCIPGYCCAEVLLNTKIETYSYNLVETLLNKIFYIYW
jgi:hypothetical protein